MAEIIGHEVNPQIHPDDKFWLYGFDAYDKNSLPESSQDKEIKSNKFILTGNCALFARLNYPEYAVKSKRKRRRR